MEVNEALIKKVAKNARLRLSDEEIKEFVSQFKEILNSFSEIKKLNTEDIKPSFQPVEIRNSLREDEPKECVPTNELLKNSKHKKGDYFLGPKAI